MAGAVTSNPDQRLSPSRLDRCMQSRCILADTSRSRAALPRFLRPIKVSTCALCCIVQRRLSHPAGPASLHESHVWLSNPLNVPGRGIYGYAAGLSHAATKQIVPDGQISHVYRTRLTPVVREHVPSLRSLRELDAAVST